MGMPDLPSVMGMSGVRVVPTIVTLPCDAEDHVLRGAIFRDMVTDPDEKAGIRPDELTVDAKRIANATEGLSDAETFAFMAWEAGMTVAELRADAERLLG